MTMDEVTGGGSAEFNSPVASLACDGVASAALDERPTLDWRFAGAENAMPAAEYPEASAEITAPGATLTPPVEAAKNSQVRKRLKQLIGYTAAAAVVAVTVIGPARSIWGPPVSGDSGSGTPPVVVPDGPSGTDVKVHTPIRTVLSEHADWYSAEYGVYLHFNEGVGWVYDHGNFHRLLWVIEGEGTADERLYVKTGYMYYAESGKRTTIERSVYVDCSELEDGSFTLAGAVGIEYADDALATFVPVDGIGVDSSIVDGLGAMSGQAVLEAIGSFAATEIRPQTAGLKWTGMSFAGGGVVGHIDNGDNLGLTAYYDRQLVPHFDTSYFRYTFDHGNSTIEGTFSGGAQFREDGVYLSFSAFGGGDTIFVSGSVPAFVTPEPVSPAAGEPLATDVADEAFPSLPNPWPDTPVEPWGSLGEYYIIFNDGIYVVAGGAYGGETASYPGASYDYATNTLTLSNCTADYLEVNWMGNGFTINLVGDNHLGGILLWGFYSGGSVTFTGSGSLTVNEGMANPYGIFINAEESRSCVMVDRGVTLDVYGNEAAIYITGIPEGKAIYYLSPLTMTGGVRGTVAEESSDRYKEYQVTYDYSVVDAFGGLATHVKFE